MIVEGKVLAKSLSHNVQLVTKELLVIGMETDTFQCRDRLGAVYKMRFNNVQSIDGMSLGRFAAVYDIKIDGTAKNTGKKRGRKPKSAQINTHEGESIGENKRTTAQFKVEQTFA